MTVALLGPLMVRGTHGPAELGGPKEQITLAVLAVSAGAVVSADRLIDAVWGDDPPATAQRTIQAHVSRLRRALADAASDVRIESRPGGWCLLSPLGRDIDEVERLAEEGDGASRRDDHVAAAAAYATALGMWRGDPLGSLAGSSGLVGFVAQADELRRSLEERHAEAQLAAGRHVEHIADLEALVAEQPLRERRWELLILGLYRAGRQADALRAYQRARHMLADELGIEPGPALRRLEADVVAHAAHLELDADAGGRQGLPEGVLTFIFTDVEGSTVLWEQHEDAMRTALAAHDDAIAMAVARHGGILLKHKGEGDSTVSVFADAASAVAAALDQQRLVGQAGAQIELRVRASVHTGPADRREGDYVGSTLNRAGRVRSLAAGGQVLITEATAQAAGDALPTDASLRDLGRHRLKGLALPEQIFQLVHPDLPDEFPPLASLGSRSTNLPLTLTSFVGREAELARVRELMDLTRLLTLTGAGGSGKTRLSLAVAGEATDVHPGGVWFVELAPVEDGDGVGAAIAAALSIQPQPGQHPLRAAEVWLADRDTTLLVLDNCEHVVPEAAAAASRLLAACPRLRILATSRERLGIDGEAVWPVPPLGLPRGGEDPMDAEAVRLFCQRSAAVGADLALDDATLAAVVELCQRLDGIPLAIELAAARVRVLSPQQIVDRLADRFALLTGGNRTALPRQQTLRALVDWSYDLLDDHERAVLRRLAVFRGRFDLDAAESVCSDLAGEVLDAVASLVDKSLVLVDTGPPPRYHLLETMRAYGLERLAESDEAEDGMRRHLGHFLRQTTEFTGAAREGTGDQRALLDAVHEEMDDLRAALAWALERDRPASAELFVRLAPFWEIRGLRVEAGRWARRMLPVLDELEGPLEAAAVIEVGKALAYDLDLQGLELVTRGSEMARQRGELLSLARGLNAQGLAKSYLGDTSGARPCYEAALDAARQALAAGDRAARQEVRICGLLLGGVVPLEQARQLLEEALADAVATSDLVLEAFLLNVLIGRFADDPALRAWVDRRLELAELLGLRQIVADSQLDLGLLALKQGDVAAGLAYVERVGQVNTDLGNPYADAWQFTAVELRLDVEGLEAAHRSLAELERRLSLRPGPPRGIAETARLMVRATLAEAEGDVATARSALHDVLELTLASSPATASWATGRLAGLEARHGDDSLAADLFGMAAALADGQVEEPVFPADLRAWEQVRSHTSPATRTKAIERHLAGGDAAIEATLARARGVAGR